MVLAHVRRIDRSTQFSSRETLARHLFSLLEEVLDVIYYYTAHFKKKKTFYKIFSLEATVVSWRTLPVVTS